MKRTAQESFYNAVGFRSTPNQTKGGRRGRKAQGVGGEGPDETGVSPIAAGLSHSLRNEATGLTENEGAEYTDQNAARRSLHRAIPEADVQRTLKQQGVL